MKDVKMKLEHGALSVRNEWRRHVSSRARPDHVLLDVGTKRDGAWQSDGIEWNSASLTPRMARKAAAALLKAADEAEEPK